MTVCLLASGTGYIVCVASATDVSYKDYLSENHATTMKMKFVKQEAVDSIINKLKNKTSQGIDGISNQILKIAKAELLRPLTKDLTVSLLLL